MSASVTIAGERALRKRMDRLGGAAQRRMARPAIREAGAQIRMKAKRSAPVAFGLLKKSIKSKIKMYRKSFVVAIIGPDSRKDAITGANPARYARLVEFGTSAHTIKPDKKKALAISQSVTTKGGKNVASGIGRNVVASVRHPGTKAQPFLRPAYSRQKSERIIFDRIKKELIKQAKKR